MTQGITMPQINTNYLNITSANSPSFSNINTNNMKDTELKSVCNKFESFFMQQLMDISLKSSNVAGEGTGSGIIKGLYTQGISDSSNGALGISDVLYKFLTQNKKGSSL